MSLVGTPLNVNKNAKSLIIASEVKFVSLSLVHTLSWNNDVGPVRAS